MAKVESKLGQQSLSFEQDSFEDFRDIELLDIKHEFQYRHSLGKVSKFFLALEEGKLLATKCERCQTVWTPPRAVCPNDLTVTHWLELSGKGTLESWTLCPKAPSYAKTDEPYILAYVRLEGASTLFLHQLRNCNTNALAYGLEVKTVFGPSAVKHPLELFWFELV